MKLENDTQLKNTRWKLSLLEDLIREKTAEPHPGPAHEASLKSLKRLAEKLRTQIEEYKSHTTAHA